MEKMRTTDEIIKEMEERKIRSVLVIIQELDELHEKEKRLAWELRESANYEKELELSANI